MTVQAFCLFKNELLGLEYFWASSNENYLEHIINKIKDITENINFNNLSKREQSLILKIRSAQDLTKIITIV